MAGLGVPQRLSDLSTHWSSVFAMRAEDEAQAAEAVSDFLLRYVPAMRQYLIGARRLNPHDADDVVQGFVTDRILVKQILLKADPERGRLRGLLKTALIRYALALNRKKRPLAVDNIEEHADQARGVDAPNPAPDPFDVAWAREVLAQTFDHVQQSLKKSGSTTAWAVFELRIVRPLLAGDEPKSPRWLVEQLGLQDAAEASNLLVTAKRAFRRSLRQIVGEYALSGIDVEQEIEDLRKILAQSVYES